LADDAPTQPEVIQILSQLYAANLVETNISPDAQVLLRRHKKQQQRKVQQRLMNLLFPRIPLWDPDRFLKIWMPLVGPLISKTGMVIWLAVVGLALFLVLPRGAELANQTSNFLQSGSIESWILLGITFLVTKFLHEMGHAFSCRRFGGECHEVGIMFLVLMPCPYVDASTAWAFPSKWKRIFVGAGGMIAEVFIASVAAIVWAFTGEGNAVHDIAYYTMLIASVSTVLFNANPLLRYDGYYILSDWLEIPNLQQKSREYSLGLVKRYIFRVKTHQPLPPTFSQKAWLVFYWVASGLYRIFIGFAIIIMVWFQLPEQVKIVGAFLAAGAIATFFIVPAFKLFKYLTTDAELHRKRTRAWAFTLATTAGILALVGLVPFPSAVRAQGIAEPLTRGPAVVETPGRVVEILASEGQRVNEGDVLFRLDNPDVTVALANAQNRFDQAEILHRATLSQDPASASISLEQLESARSQLVRAQEDVDELVVVAPTDGFVLMGKEPAEFVGRYFQRGTPLAQVQDDASLEIFAPIDQGDFQRVLGTDETTRDVQLRFVGNPDVTYDGEATSDVRLLPAASKDIRSPSLTFAAGGTLAPDPQDPSKSAQQQFEMRVVLTNAVPTVGDAVTSETPYRFVPGQRVHVRVALADEPLATQAWRGFLQLIQSENVAAGQQTSGAM
ncbi:MAG: HlyD family efflux transporter periplasmic adaptor subunit, partial [Planctomycetota bacterium]